METAFLLGSVDSNPPCVAAMTWDVEVDDDNVDEAELEFC